MKRLEEIKKRLGEISAELEGFKSAANLTEHIETIKALKVEFEGLKDEKEALETVNALTVEASSSQRQAPQAATPVKRIEVVDRNKTTGGFQSLGDFAMAVKNHSRGQVDNRFANSTHFEFSGEDGGFLIPEDYLTGIEQKMGGDASLWARARAFQTASNHLSLPIDETQPWNGGVQAIWMEEGGSHVASKVSLGRAKFELNKLGVFVKATDELLEDAASLESYIKESAPSAINYQLNNAIISGDGVGKPVGLLNSSFKLTVAKEVGQAADTIVYKNLIKMKSRLLGQGVWIAHSECREQLMQLKDDNGNFIYLNGSQFANASVSPFETLLGLPIVYMNGSMPALGDEGDLILANMDYYYSVTKRGGVKSAMSTHLYFDKDITAFKFTLRLDGKCPFSSPVVTENGAYSMSAFVTIADRV